MIKNDSFRIPQNESCYDYLLWCHKLISSEVGEYTAFKNGNRDTSFPEFIAAVEKLSSFLTAKGYGKEDVFTVLLPTTADAVVIFYALSRSGIIANFVHPLTPPDGVAKIHALTGAKGIFITEQALPAYKGVLEGMLTVSCSLADFTKDWCEVPESTDGVLRMSDIIKSDVEILPAVKKDAHDAALYMHGSGTTGEPKTVILSAWAINWNTYGQFVVDNNHDWGKSYSLCVLPFFHAFGLTAALCQCMCKSYAPIFMPKFDAEKANEIIENNYVQYIAGAPAMFQKMAAMPNFENKGLKNLNALYSGGDIVAESVVQEINEMLKRNGAKGEFFRGWGLTEMAACCTSNRLDITKADSIGRPFNGITVASIDENGEFLPAGVNGELILTGNSMMNGYLGDETNCFFVDKNSTKWIKTGDMGYVDEDGFVFFTGRRKRIIIISGYNVYPYEIEQAVNHLSYIKEACAVQGYNEMGKPYVKLCVSLNKTELTHEEITEQVIDYCKSKFYAYSVPRKVVFMEELPRTKMAKLDFMSMSDPVPQGN